MGVVWGRYTIMIQNLKDFIVLSVYDNGFYFSLMVNGKIYGTYDLEHKRKFKWLYNVYKDASGSEDMDVIVNTLQRDFPDKTIIVCDGGGIEIYEKEDKEREIKKLAKVVERKDAEDLYNSGFRAIKAIDIRQKDARVYTKNGTIGGKE